MRQLGWAGAEIKEDRVRLPAAEGTDGSLVAAGDKEGGGTAGAEAVGFDAVRGDICDVVDSGDGLAEGNGDVAGGHVVRAPFGVIIAIEGSVGGGGEGAEVFDAVAEGADGAQVEGLDVPWPRASPRVQFFWSV